MRVYRDAASGVTWIERGSGGPMIVIDDHGSGVSYQWNPPELGTLVYDDVAHEAEHETITAALLSERVKAALLSERIRIRDAVVVSTIPAPAKATVRKIIGEPI